ncbi:uncharacterized protein [Aegilops tauschii subsp. strangulata]|uniref:uncharacterized protein n=1 Tax=Aegilops tauschii subsp. strangulata TaxID=200361 RepID=UPI00098A9F87|nr:uncharacterized protein LOC109739319 [Aegilops tauschii subsp. strangulata]
MARPSYAYLKLKMSGPTGVITVLGDPRRAKEIVNLNASMAEESGAKVEFVAYKLTVDPTEMPMEKKLTPEPSFHSATGTKNIQVHPCDPSKTAKIDDDLDPK